MGETIMNTLETDLEKIAEGWNAQRAIQTRAVLMRNHIEAGNMRRAEEYAVEIDQLQVAETVSLGMAIHECPPHMEEWTLALLPWANILIGGGYRRERIFWETIGATPGQLLAHAQTVFSNRWIGLQDVAPVYPATLSMAAE
jgi:hypothetical protein